MFVVDSSCVKVGLEPIQRHTAVVVDVVVDTAVGVHVEGIVVMAVEMPCAGIHRRLHHHQHSYCNHNCTAWHMLVEHEANASSPRQWQAGL